MFSVKSTRVNKREDNTLYIEQCFVFSDNPLLKTCLLYLPSDLSYFLPNCWHLASCLGTPPPWQASVRTHQQSVVVGQRCQHAHGSCLAQACCDLVSMLGPCQGPCFFICLFFLQAFTLLTTFVVQPGIKSFLFQLFSPLWKILDVLKRFVQSSLKGNLVPVLKTIQR